MLIPLARVATAMHMNAALITIALQQSGYPEDSVTSATFKGFDYERSTFVYDCTFYNNIEGRHEQCNVYIRFAHDGKIVADY